VGLLFRQRWVEAWCQPLDQPASRPRSSELIWGSVMNQRTALAPSIQPLTGALEGPAMSITAGSVWRSVWFLLAKLVHGRSRRPRVTQAEVLPAKWRRGVALIISDVAWFPRRHDVICLVVVYLAHALNGLNVVDTERHLSVPKFYRYPIDTSPVEWRGATESDRPKWRLHSHVTSIPDFRMSWFYTVPRISLEFWFLNAY
jgi:hypothetical protein